MDSSTEDSQGSEGSETESESGSEGKGKGKVAHAQRNGGRVFGAQNGEDGEREGKEVCCLLVELREADCVY
jgi:hypothetical protein